MEFVNPVQILKDLRIDDLTKNSGFQPLLYRTLHDEINLAAEKDLRKIGRSF